MTNKILIAEDDKFLANAYRVKFEKEGFEVWIAYDGEETIRMAKEKVPPVILLDLVMPKLDGFGTLVALKQEPKTQGIRVVVASNLGQEEDIKRAKELGADDYIIKSETELGQIVEKIKKYY